MKTTNTVAIFIELNSGVTEQTFNIDVVDNFPLVVTITKNHKGGRTIKAEKVKRISAGKFSQ